MDDESERPKQEYSVARSKMSKTPSWIMLGFVLGALFVVALPPLEKKKPAASAPPEMKTAEPPKPAAPSEPPLLTTIEDVFATWGHLAVWSDHVTEVALWNIDRKAFSDFYEVRRVDGLLYFRTIPRLTRRVITRGKPIPECPLVFTETEEQYREWRDYGRSERPTVTELRPPAPRPNPSGSSRVGEKIPPATAPVIERPTFEPPSGKKPE